MNQTNRQSITEGFITDITSKMTVWAGHWSNHYNSLGADDLVCPKEIAMKFLSDFFDDFDYERTQYTASTPKFQQAFDNLKRATFAIDIDGCLRFETMFTQEDQSLLAECIGNPTSFDPTMFEMVRRQHQNYEQSIRGNYEAFCSSIEEELLSAINEIANHLLEIHGRHLEMFRHLQQVLEEGQSKKRRRSEGDPSSRLNHLKLKKKDQVGRYSLVEWSSIIKFMNR